MASNSVSAQIDEILTTYESEVHDVMETTIEEEAKKTAKQLKSTSPKRASGSKRGAYARSWRVTKRGRTYIVHNAKHYRLTHLLENGHVVRNAKGTYGRAAPIKHIEPALKEAETELPLKLESRLRQL